MLGKLLRKTWFWLLLLGALLGVAALGVTVTVMHKTSSTEFCVSCHSMQTPLAEYQGSVHFQNVKGIRAECADCHIPGDPTSYLWTKIRAVKDIYHEAIGTLDTPEKYEAHKLRMAQSVWDELKANDSATCRSCHSYAAMDILAQRPNARAEHPVAIKEGQTCIDCHRGVAHIMPDMSGLAAAGASELAQAAAQTPTNVTTRYAIATTPLYLDVGAKTDEGTLMPSTQVEVLANDNGRAQVRIDGWQQDGVSEVFYAAPGKRILSTLLGDKAKAQLTTGKSETDSATSLTWHQVSLTAWVDQSQLIGDQGKLWQYASTLMSNNCTGCHGLTALDHFNANQWIGVIKGMESRTSLTPEQARMLTQYVQKHASDMNAAH
ncbi:NapC/NirT family cytochrome c [Aeromonas hydrophila]|uniref:NapC/NirT family cytochrome c n=1 Tax=Aeromonas hydrophila TaxID=644 RepID=UPI0035A26C98